MKGMVLLTCTGDRRECLAHLAGLVARRVASMKEKVPVRWLVVDDGAEPSEDCLAAAAGVKVDYLRRERCADDPAHTLPANLLEARKAVGRDDAVVFLEDDDYYHDGWLDACARALSGGVDIFGEADAAYYHVAVPGTRLLSNKTHASLAATAMSPAAWDRFSLAAPTLGTPVVDEWAWETLPKEGFRMAVKAASPRMVPQFKGMPGRKSTLLIHQFLHAFKPDPGLRKLAALVEAQDLGFYTGIVERARTGYPEALEPRKKEGKAAEAPRESVIDAMYRRQLGEVTDIHEHLPTLKALAEGRRVVELGVRGGASTLALLAGRPQWLRSYDIEVLKDARAIETQAVAEGMDFRLEEADDLKIEIPACDFMFVDTWGVGPQLFAELSLHAKNVAKTIALHDTATFATKGEGGAHPGLLSGLNQFLATEEGSKWWVRRVYLNNNGLTIMERKA